MRPTLVSLLIALSAVPSALAQGRLAGPPLPLGAGRAGVAAAAPRVPGVSSASAAGTVVGVPGGASSRTTPGLPTRVPGVQAAAGLAREASANVRVTEAMIARAAPTEVRHLQVRRLLQRHADRVDLDVRGEPVLRREFLVIDPDPATLDAVARAGFTAREADGHAATLALRIVVLEDTRARGARQAMEALERAAPGVEFAYQHVYLPSGTPASAPLVRAGPGDGAPLRVGLVDGGVDAKHPALAGLRVRHHGCDGRALPRPHGTAVAVRLAGGGRGELYSADLWCGDGPGQATLGLVQALAWMSRERVPVVNISLVGPSNPVLARAVRAMQARGHVLVAAVGNDGPAAPPLYPAAYEGVVGVAAVDARHRLLPESGSGAHVDFVAPGVVSGGRRPLRGTSFAAPVVARSLAHLLHAPAPAQALRALGLLERQARDLGRPGPDTRYGRGLIAVHF